MKLKFLFLSLLLFTACNADSLPLTNPEAILDITVSKAVAQKSILSPANLEKREVSKGKGFLISEKGQLITSAHLVEGSGGVEVLLENQLYPAEIVTLSQEKDLALLKISAEKNDLPFLNLSSEGVQIKDKVFIFRKNERVVGNIQALNRSIEAGSVALKKNLNGLMETRLSLGEGESGSPLFNSKGLVIGVNTAIDPKNTDISFAVPVEIIKEFIEVSL